MKDLLERVRKIKRMLEGGAGSGNFGHGGRPGERGGSGEGGDSWGLQAMMYRRKVVGHLDALSKKAVGLDKYQKLIKMVKAVQRSRGGLPKQIGQAIRRALKTLPFEKSGNEAQHALALSCLKEGGPGSGNFGHAGRPGERGGSSGEGGGGGETGSKESDWDKQGVQRPGNAPHAGYEIGRGWYANLDAFRSDMRGMGLDTAKEAVKNVLAIPNERWPGNSTQKITWVAAALKAESEATARKADSDKEFAKELAANKAGGRKYGEGEALLRAVNKKMLTSEGRKEFLRITKNKVKNNTMKRRGVANDIMRSAR